MWGERGFQAAYQQAETNKRSVKEFLLSLENWAEILENKAKQVNRLCRSFPETIEQAGSTFRRLWKKLLERFKLHARWCVETAEHHRKAAAELRITKGEMKHLMKMLVEHKAKLERELEVSKDLAARALEKRNRLQKELEAAYLAMGRSRASTATNPSVALRGEKADLDFKQGEHQYTEAQRNLVATQTKHDVCLAQCLYLFQCKEKRRVVELKRKLESLSKHCHDILNRFAGANKNLELAVEALDVDSDLRDFVLSTYDHNTPMHLRVQPSRNIDFVTHLSANSYELASGHTTKGMTAIATMIQLMDELLQVEDTENKWLRRFTWDNPSSSASTLRIAFDTFKTLMDGFSNHGERQVGQCRESVIAPLQQLRANLKSKLQIAEAEMLNVQRKLELVTSTLERAVSDEKRAFAGMKSAQEKLTRAQTETPNSIMSLFASSVESLQIKLTTATREAEERKTERIRAEQELERTNKMRDETLARILVMFQQTEQQRIETTRQAFNNMLQHSKTYLNEIGQLVAKMSDEAEAIDADMDAQLFIRSKATNEVPPVCVVEEHDRQLLHQLEEIKEEKEREILQQQAPHNGRTKSESTTNVPTLNLPSTQAEFRQRAGTIAVVREDVHERSNSFIVTASPRPS
eukprot:TRINITY_DN3777_c0_g1_i1.p1 TRINITY_DN3777_c0_g1~~TRINITY_DN3777_c0_g1_i1.p1  ORF type:complete len:715 (-),score=190.11 TRINITY_DN3777_c0_g1_i1:67-1977(-)